MCQILFCSVKFYKSTFLSSPICSVRILTEAIFWHIQNKLTQLYVRMIEFMFIIFFPWWCWWNRFYDLDFLKVQILFSKLCNLSPALSCEWISLLSKCNLHCWRKVILLVNYSSTLLRTMKLVTILIINSFGFSQKSLPTCTYT